MQDLSVLTPPLLMCAAVLFAVGAFLRHEMRRRRPDDPDGRDDIPAAPPISGQHAGSKSGSDSSPEHHAG